VREDFLNKWSSAQNLRDVQLKTWGNWACLFTHVSSSLQEEHSREISSTCKGPEVEDALVCRQPQRGMLKTEQELGGETREEAGVRPWGIVKVMIWTLDFILKCHMIWYEVKRITKHRDDVKGYHSNHCDMWQRQWEAVGLGCVVHIEERVCWWTNVEWKGTQIKSNSLDFDLNNWQTGGAPYWDREMWGGVSLGKGGSGELTVCPEHIVR
jgi:hypothetical protein